MNAAALIAIDWGTTRARAYRMDRNGRVLGERTEPLGIQQLGGLGFPDALSRLLGDWDGDAVPRLACGMVGSRQGWREAPYVECPASLESLARGLVETVAGGLAIVPGLATRDAAGVPDVMRGEETQLLGALPADVPRTLAVLPGTHSKWARVERGVVLDFTTFMTGELYEALVAHTILGRLAAAPGEGAEAAFIRGVERGLAAGALMHDAFGARTLALAGELRRAGVAVDLDPAGKGPGTGLKHASKKGCRTAVLLGQKERESGIAVVKDLVERSQREVALADLPRFLKGETP